METLANAVPVVLKNCHFGDVTQAWTIDYLKENLLSPNLTVYVSPTRRFLFYNSNFENGSKYTWTPPHKHEEMNFTEFLDAVDELDKVGNGTRAYLQSNLEKDLLNADMQDDIFMFDTLWLKKLKEKLGWGRQESNLLLIGMAGVVTPAHYDIMENLFLQIYGRKRCILFSPENYKYLYPFPLHHPHDRQSQVNFDSPDFERFPKFNNITGVDAVVGPGDVLYIPNYWWHYIESERNSKTISMNFWYLPKDDSGHAEEETIENNNREAKEEQQIELRKQEDETKKNKGETGQSKEMESKGKEKKKGVAVEERQAEDNETEIVPLTAGNLIGLSREIEEMVGTALGDVTKVGEFLRQMVDGRYDFV